MSSRQAAVTVQAGRLPARGRPTAPRIVLLPALALATPVVATTTIADGLRRPR